MILPNDDFDPPIHPDLPPTPGIVSCLLTDALDALSEHPDIAVRDWVAAAGRLLPDDLANRFSVVGPPALTALYCQPQDVN